MLPPEDAPMSSLTVEEQRALMRIRALYFSDEVRELAQSIAPPDKVGAYRASIAIAVGGRA